MTAEPPVFAYDWRGLAAQADEEVRLRNASYPHLVQADKISAELAEADTRAWEAIAAEWRWAATHETTPGAPDIDDKAKAVAVREAVRRTRGKLQDAFDEFVERESERQAENRNPIDVRHAVANNSLQVLRLIFGGSVGPFLASHYRYERLLAMQWWSERRGTQSLRFMVETTLTARAQSRERARLPRAA